MLMSKCLFTRDSTLYIMFIERYRALSSQFRLQLTLASECGLYTQKCMALPTMMVFRTTLSAIVGKSGVCKTLECNWLRDANGDP